MHAKVLVVFVHEQYLYQDNFDATLRIIKSDFLKKVMNFNKI